MIPRIDFVRPSSLKEALAVLDRHRDAVVLAGGTDVIPGMQQGDQRFMYAGLLLDIHHLAELRNISETESGLHIGAAVTFSAIAGNPLAQSKFPLLVHAVASIGSVQIRNRATLAGNFVNNAACADSVPPLLVYDARVHIRSAHSEREMPLTDFLLKPNCTALQNGELVTDVLLPNLPKNYCGAFRKLGRRRGIAISRITLAVLLQQAGGQIHDLRIASGAVTPIGVRFRDLEAHAKGKTASDTLWTELAQELGNAVLEKTGLRWSSPYKLPVVQQMCFALLCDLSHGRSA
jgi:CO/xanthine dehydrogenase FAD-binding subunit